LADRPSRRQLHDEQLPQLIAMSAAMVVVGMKPGGGSVASFSVRPVGAGVGPFVGQGAMEAFDFTESATTRLSPIHCVVTDAWQ
jgi:hypothetical protein